MEDMALNRLLTTSKLFRDASLTHVLNENKKLKEELNTFKLEKFWGDNNINVLKMCLTQLQSSMRCTCTDCRYSGMIQLNPNQMREPIRRECIFVPWFIAQLEACNLTYTVIGKDYAIVCHSAGYCINIPGISSHFVKTKTGFAYGKLLYDAKTFDDPELGKLRRLFNLIISGNPDIE